MTTSLLAGTMQRVRDCRGWKWASLCGALSELAACCVPLSFPSSTLSCSSQAKQTPCWQPALLHTR